MGYFSHFVDVDNTRLITTTVTIPSPSPEEQLTVGTYDNVSVVFESETTLSLVAMPAQPIRLFEEVLKTVKYVNTIERYFNS